MLSEITTALASLKAASDILQGFNELQLEVAVKEKTTELFNIIISLQSDIIIMQTEYSELLSSRNNIEKELVEVKKNIIDRTQYNLCEIAPGIMVYSPNKAKSNNTEPDHFLCQICLDTKNQKSVLQRKYAEHNDLICYSCNTTLRLPDDAKPQIMLTR